MEDKKYMTEPMTEEQFLHLTALFFNSSLLVMDESAKGSLVFGRGDATYKNYLHECKHTKLEV